MEQCSYADVRLAGDGTPALLTIEPSPGSLMQMRRDADEVMAQVLTRMVKTIQKKAGKKQQNKKKKKGAKAQQQPQQQQQQQQQQQEGQGENGDSAPARPLAQLLSSTGDVLDAATLKVSQLESGMVLQLDVAGLFPSVAAGTDDAGAQRSFVFRVNPPQVVEVRVTPTSPLFAGSPVCCWAHTEFADNADIVWLVKMPDAAATAAARALAAEEKDTIEGGEGAGAGYVAVARGAYFVPGPEHVGGRLQVRCTPTASASSGAEQQNGSAEHKHSGIATLVCGRHQIVVLPDPIQPALPTPLMADLRQPTLAATESAGASRVRMCTFNILADPYCTSEFARNKLYSHAPLELLSVWRRAQLTLREIDAYAPLDVLFLQEVDRKVFSMYLEPYLCHRHHMYGAYLNKDGSSLEGCALFVSLERFEVLETIDLSLKEALHSMPEMAAVHRCRPHAADIICSKVTTVAQIAVLRSRRNPEAHLIVANTHLFYHPDAQWVRLFQTHAILHRVAQLRDALLTRKGAAEENVNDNDTDTDGAPARPVSVVFGGDLNSTADTSIIEYLRTGSIPSTHRVWQTMDTFRWGTNFFEDDLDRLEKEGKGPPKRKGADGADSAKMRKRLERAAEKRESAATAEGATEPAEADQEEDSADAHLQTPTAEVAPHMEQDLELVDFCLEAGAPFTNWAIAFAEVLDYLYVTRRHFVHPVVHAFPAREDVTRHTSIPSPEHSSDHISVLLDVDWVVEAGETEPEADQEAPS